jgi:hypothetical protein
MCDVHLVTVSLHARTLTVSTTVYSAQGSSQQQQTSATSVSTSATTSSTTSSALQCVYFEVLQVAAVKLRLSLQRPHIAAQDVRTSLRPAQLLLDVMMRMDRAHINLPAFIMHHETVAVQQVRHSAIPCILAD